MKVLALLCLFVFVNLFSQGGGIQRLKQFEYKKFDNEWFKLVNGEKADPIDIEHLIVKLKKGLKYQNIEYAKYKIPNILALGKPDNFGYCKISIPPNTDPFIFGKKLVKTNLFEYVYFNSYGTLTEVTPNDPYFVSGHHWNLNRIHMPEAWDVQTGLGNVVVAVIDMGIDYLDHPDIKFSNVLAGDSRNFINPDDPPLPDPEQYHGTAVAGIIGAALSNNTLVSGIAGGWDSQNGIKLMSLRIGPSEKLGGGYVDLSAASDAFEYLGQWAEDNPGKKVIACCSWTSRKADEIPDLAEKINAAFWQGVLILFSSGNIDGDNSYLGVKFPATMENVIAVGASTPNNLRKIKTDGYGNWASCYGPELDIMAPGVDIPTLDNIGVNGENETDVIEDFLGTSAAAPHVAGVAALLWSNFPELTNEQIMNRLYNNTDYMSGGSNQVGHGLVNAWNAFYDDVPVSATIEGPEYLQKYETGTFYAGNKTGESPFTYTWYLYRYGLIGPRAPVNQWFQIGTGASVDVMDYLSLKLRLVIRDSRNIPYTVEKYVEVGSGGLEAAEPDFEEAKIEISTQNRALPDDYELFQNYPNPFNPVTTIRFALPTASHVKIILYNSSGIEIVTILDEEKSAGYFDVRFNASDLSSGIYFYQFRADGKTQTRKMLLMK